MGYKLAGFEVAAANDIDPQMQEMYLANHHPEKYYLAPIEELLKKGALDDLPEFDVLDGSPPCSVFSIAGKREKGWQVEKHFREGQSRQILDDLFFQFVELARITKPKVVIAENVKGMLSGNARWYTREVVRRMDAAGYDTRVHLVRGSRMGVPQRRERVFFLSKRRDLNLPGWPDMRFDEQPITLRDIHQGTYGKPGSDKMRELWANTRPGLNFSTSRPENKNRFFNHYRMAWDRVMNTLTSGCENLLYMPDKPCRISQQVVISASTFPLDYDFVGMDPGYVCGMSVPPVMMANVAERVRTAWFDRKPA